MAEPGPPIPRPNVKPWAIGGALVVIAGIVAALVSGGGTSEETSSSSARLPPGGQATVVRNAPPPKPGDKVLAASETDVHGIRYRVVASTTGVADPKRGVVPLYFNEYLAGKLVQRYKVPNAPFYRDSAIEDFRVEANPDPNPSRSAGVAFSWFRHLGDQRDETKYYHATPEGIRLY
jgi:hypothetical protein